jgi:hypothetical protein
MADPRTANRRPSTRAGTIKVGEREQTVVLRDMSQESACVRLVGSGDIPDRFRLVAPMEKIDSECVVVWRRGRDCGVRFE